MCFHSARASSDSVPASATGTFDRGFDRMVVVFAAEMRARGGPTGTLDLRRGGLAGVAERRARCGCVEEAAVETASGELGAVLM